MKGLHRVGHVKGKRILHWFESVRGQPIPDKVAHCGVRLVDLRDMSWEDIEKYKPLCQRCFKNMIEFSSAGVALHGSER